VHDSLVLEVFCMPGVHSIDLPEYWFGLDAPIVYILWFLGGDGYGLG